MPGQGPTQLITDVARTSCVGDIKLPTAAGEDIGTSAGCSLKGFIWFVGMRGAGEASSMAAAPGHNDCHDNKLKAWVEIDSAGTRTNCEGMGRCSIFFAISPAPR